MPDADGAPAKKLQVMQLEGYLPTAKANLELQESLQKTKVSKVTAHVTTAVFCMTSGYCKIPNVQFWGVAISFQLRNASRALCLNHNSRDQLHLCRRRMYAVFYNVSNHESARHVVVLPIIHLPAGTYGSHLPSCKVM